MFQAPNLQLAMQLLKAVKCNLTELTLKESQRSLVVGGFLHMHMRWNSMCSSFEVFLRVISACTCSVVRSGSSSSSQFPPPIPFLFPLFIQCDGCLFPFPVWGLMAWLPGFSSHERGLHLGAGCQWWKFLVFQAPNLQLATQLLTWINRLQVYLFQH